MSDGKGPLEFGCHDHWTWDENAKSHEAILCDPRTVLFHPSWSNSTAGVRGTRILNNGIHYWEILLSPRVFGTSIMFGIGKGSARLHDRSFVNLLGRDDCSWGLSHKGLAVHKGRVVKFTRPFEENKVALIGLLFDGINGTLTYYKDGVCLGVAFKGLNQIKEPLYPLVASSSSKIKMTLVNTKHEFGNLQDMCREVIAQNLTSLNHLESLCLPISIKLYIKDSVFEQSESNLVPHAPFKMVSQKPCFLP